MGQPDRPRVSAVMTVYNQAEYLPAALQSVLDQDEPDVEIVVVDDGSTEDLGPALAPFADRIRLVKRANGGLAAARNTGVEAARGQYVAFCDSDDIHLPYRLSAHAALLDQAPDAAQVFSDLYTWDGDQVTVDSTLRDRNLGPVRGTFDEALARCFGPGRTARERGLSLPSELLDKSVYQGKIPQLIAVDHIAWGGSSMYRREAVVAVGGHDPVLRRWPDWGLASKLSKSYELVYLDVPVILYRQHDKQLTKQSEVGARSYHHVAETVWLNDPVFCAQFPDERDRLTYAAAMRMATVHVRHGEWAPARDLLGRAIRAKPWSRSAYTAWLRAAVMLQASRLRRAVSG